MDEENEFENSQTFLNPIHERIEENFPSRNELANHASSMNVNNAPNLVNAGFDSDHEENKEEKKEDDIFNQGKKVSLSKN